MTKVITQLLLGTSWGDLDYLVGSHRDFISLLVSLEYVQDSE